MTGEEIEKLNGSRDIGGGRERWTELGSDGPLTPNHPPALQASGEKEGMRGNDGERRGRTGTRGGGDGKFREEGWWFVCVWWGLDKRIVVKGHAEVKESNSHPKTGSGFCISEIYRFNDTKL